MNIYRQIPHYNVYKEKNYVMLYKIWRLGHRAHTIKGCLFASG